MNPDKGKLTDKAFWGDVWDGVKLPSYPDPRKSFDRCLGNAFREVLNGCSGTVLEIGCAPGTWLAFLARELGLNPAGLEYSEIGLRATQHNLELLRIDGAAIYAGDLFEIEPEPRFNVVLSLGFIEHFDNPDSAIERHLGWLKPGGLLVLGVPNFRGFNGWLQSILNPALLARHNLEIMNLEFFRTAAARFGLKLHWLNYLGSFEPHLMESPVKVRSIPQFLAKTFVRIALKVRPFRIFDRLNHAAFSGYMLAAFVKPECAAAPAKLNAKS